MTPRPPRTSVTYLQDISDACQKATQFVASMDYPQFAGDDKTLYAVIRALEVVGEAAKKVAPDVRAKYPEVPWREMAAIRDKLIHDYFGVNPVVVWKTVTEDVPLLASLIGPVLKSELSAQQTANRGPSDQEART